MHEPTIQHSLGAVAIGRNEGDRLVRCLRSLVGRVGAVVYVDSGSSDGSVDAARELGAEVVELDTSIPFTAARGRNAGFRRLTELLPDLAFVQFVDGDCEVVDGWLEQGREYLEANEDVAVVSGRRRERHRAATTYNRLCDMEWDTTIGEVRACHGDAMMRASALAAVGGFREDLIAGEEPELCVRLREAGWRIVRLDAEMTLHDAAMTRFGQWWKRARRAGHAYAEGAWLHGGGPSRHNVRAVVSIAAWAVVLPAAVLLLLWPSGGWSVLLFAAYGALGWRVYRWRRRRGDAPEDARLYAVFNVLAKFAQTAGMATFIWRRLVLRRKSRLLEYKDARPAAREGAPQRDTEPMRIAYLINQYPRVSHTFIRREIEAIEWLAAQDASGAGRVEVLRYSLRPCPDELADEADRRELALTRVVLGGGTGAVALRLAGHAAVTALARPRRFARALAMAVRLGRWSDAGVARHMAYLAEACVLERWVRAAGCAHIHAHFATNPTAVALLARLLGGPTFSFTVHGPAEIDRLAALGLEQKLRHAAFAVTISRYTWAQVMRWCDPVDHARIHVVRCGLDEGFRDAPAAPPGDSRRFVCVARLSAVKGLHVLIEAFADVARDDASVELVLVGDGPERGAIERSIARHGLEQRVRLTGWASGEAVRRELGAARAFVLPSFAEGLPVVLMEALALRRPVVSTAIAGVPELIEPGITGWLVPTGSSEPLARAMREVLEADADALGAMGERGAARVWRDHDVRTEARRLLALWRGEVAPTPEVAGEPAPVGVAGEGEGLEAMR